MRRLTIHIGTHKTGSTSIQRALRVNRTRLMLEGIRYLVRLPESHRLMGMTAVDPDLVTAGRDYLHGKASSLVGRLRRWHGVLSSEGYSGDPLSGYRNVDVQARTLAQIAEGHDVRIVVYLRRQDRFIESLYAQQIHQGEHYSIGEFISGLRPVDFDWTRILRAYAECFGAENVVARPYGRSALPGPASLIRDFGVLLGSRVLARHTPPYASNPSYTPAAVKLARLCNRFLESGHQGELRKVLQAISSGAPFLAGGQLSIAERDEVLSHYVESNADLTRRYFDDSASDVFSRDPNEDEAPAVIPTEEVRALLDRVVTHARTSPELAGRLQENARLLQF